MPLRARTALIALTLTTVLAGCGGSIGANDWTLMGMTPDQQHLLISTLFGGVASGCTRWEGWEVEESSEQVEVRALVWRKTLPSGCTDEGVIETFEVDLDEPLDDRQLVGCGYDDCLTLDFDSSLGSWEVDAAANPNGVTVMSAGALWGFGVDGEELWSHDPGTVQLLQAPFATVVGYDGSSVLGYDPLSGEEIWQIDGYIGGSDKRTTYVCRGEDAGLVSAIDPETGDERWQANLPCGLVVVDEEVMTIVAIDPAVDGGHELLRVDTATGEVLIRKTFDDGVDDRVNGFDGAVSASDHVVVGGVQADLVVLGPEGEEVIRLSGRGHGRPIEYADGLVVLASHDRAAAIDPSSGETVWKSVDHNHETLAVSEDALWSLDKTAGSVSRVDPRTGQPLWSTSIGVTSGFDIASDGPVTYVATSLAIIALDSETGDMLWWQHVPFQG